MTILDPFMAAHAEGETKLSEAVAADGVVLADVKAEAVKKYKEVKAAYDESPSDELLEEIEALTAITKTVHARIVEKAAANEQRSERAKHAAEEMAGLEDEEESSDEDLEPEAVAVPETTESIPVVEVPENSPVPVSPERELVTAAASKKVDFSRLPSTPVNAEKEPPKYTIVAAADLPGYATGSELQGLPDIAKALMAKMTGLSRLGPGRTANAPIASIRRHRDPRIGYNPSKDGMGDAADAVKYATNFQERLREHGSLENFVAAGGWCAPSETIYDLCPPASVDGLVDIPEISAPRGGVRFPAGVDFSTVYAGGFHQTEAQAIAGTTKPCIEITCPTFTEVRLELEGFCVKAPILTDVAYPELGENFIANVLAAHAHRINAFKIARMVALSTANTVTPVPDFGAGTTALEYLELHAEWVRYRHRLPLSTPLEVVLPAWSRGAFRADFSKKNGVDLTSVSDERLNRYFLDRNMRVQWVYDWQDALVSGVATDFGGATVQDTWPATVQALIYPAGTFFAPTLDVITLDSIYDSTDLSTNVFTKLFTEEGVNVAKQCFTSFVVTLPVCAAGGSGAQYSPTCSGGTQLPAAA